MSLLASTSDMSGAYAFIFYALTALTLVGAIGAAAAPRIVHAAFVDQREHFGSQRACVDATVRPEREEPVKHHGQCQYAADHQRDHH